MEDDLGFDIVDLDNGGDNNDLGFDVLSDNDLGFDVLSEREQVEIDQANYVADRGTLGQAGDSLKRGGSRSLAALSVSNARATDDQAERYQKLLETELAKPEFTSDNAAEYRPGQFRSKRKIQRYENAIARSNANTDEALDRAIKADQIGQAIPQAPVISYAMEAETAGEFLSRVGIDAGSFIGNITLESAPSFVSSAAGGVAGFAVGGAVGAAVGSGLAAGGDDYNFTFLESLREQGVDLSDKKALREAFRDPAMMDAIRNDALKRATVVGGAAGLTAYIAPLRLFPTDTLTKLAADVTGKAVVGAGLDGAGEYFGERARGREASVGEVGAEILGGVGGSAVEVAPLAVQGSRQAVQKLLPDTDPQEGDTELDQFIDENAEGLGLVDPDEVTAPTRTRSGLIGPDQVAAIDASTLSLDGVEANDGLAVETPAELEARLYPPQEGDFDYIPPENVTTGDLELSPEGTGVDGSLARTERPAAPVGELSLEPLDESAPVSRSQAGLQIPPVDVLELENEQEAEARLAQQGEPAAELPRTPELVNAQKFTRLANQYDELASNATDPEIKSGLERQAEIARKTAAGESVKLTPKERAAQVRVIKPGSDTIDIAVRRLGGLDVDTETDFAGRLSQLDANDKTPGLPKIEQRNGKGLTLDALTERLMTEGFVDQFDQKILSDLLERAAGGEEIYSNAVDFDLLAQRDFEQERDDDAFRTAVQVANIRPLKETTQELIDLGLSKTEVDRLLGELRADGLTAPEISEGFEDMADAMRERARSQSTVPADSGIQSETPSNEQANGSGAGPQSELRSRSNQQRQSQRQGELPNDEDGQHSATVEPLRQGEDVKQRQHEVDTTDGSGEQSASRARNAEKQHGGERDKDKSQDNSERGSGERQGSSARATDEQSGSDSEGQVGKDSASGDGSVRSKADRQKPRRKAVLLNLVDKEAARADPAPTPGQAEAGNYQKGHVNLLGRKISIETAKGADRVGYNDKGEEIWRNKMGAHYGQILGTVGKDGDPLDIFLGDNADDADKFPVWVMNQRKPDGTGFDEHKFFAGFTNGAQARKAYMASYPKGWKGENKLVSLTKEEFKLFIENGDMNKIFSKAEMARLIQAAEKKPEQTEADVKAAKADKKKYTLNDDMRKRMTEAPAPVPSMTNPGPFFYISTGRTGSLMTLRRAEYTQSPFSGYKGPQDHYWVTLGQDFERSAAKAFESMPPGATLYNATPAGSGVRPNAKDAGEMRFGKYRGLNIVDLLEDNGVSIESPDDSTPRSTDVGYVVWLATKGIATINKQPKKFQAAFKEATENSDAFKAAMDEQDAKDAAKKEADNKKRKDAAKVKAGQQWAIDILEDVQAKSDYSDFPQAMADRLADTKFKDLSPKQQNAIVKMIAKERTNGARVNSKAYKAEAVEVQKRFGSSETQEPGTKKSSSKTELSTQPKNNQKENGVKYLDIDYPIMLELVGGLARGEYAFKYSNGVGSIDGTELMSGISTKLNLEQATSLVLEQLRQSMARQGVSFETDVKKMDLDTFSIAQRFADLIGDFEISAEDMGTVITSAADGRLQVDIRGLYEKIQRQIESEETGSAPGKPLEDFGNKIGGARKDVYSRYGKGYDIEVDYETAPLSKALPKPDYEAMAADGISQRNIAFVAFMRADLGQRPKGRYARSRTAEWVKKAGIYRVLAQEIMEKRSLDIPDTGDLRVQLDFLQSVPPDLVDKASAYTMQEYDKLDQKTLQPNGIVAFEIRKRTGNRRPIARAEDDMQAAIKQAVDFLRKPADKKGGGGKRKPIPLGVYTDRSTRKSFIGFKRVGTYVRIKDGFDGHVKAQAYLRENREALDAQVEEMRGPPNLRTEANRVRIGKPRRDGDVTPEDFGVFGLYGVEFGNWVEGPKRQANLNEAYDALIDMAEALNFEPAALSLGGTLGLAFGARGVGGANAGAAHFEPGSIAINLTKKAGAGSLAHEWLHAIDNYFARVDMNIDGRRPFDGFLTDSKSPSSVRPELHAAWADVVSSFEDTRMLRTSKEVDALFKGKKYFQTNIELMARAFETYITDKLAKAGITNDYLANIDKSSGVYPDADELKVIAPKFDKFFSQLKQEKTEAGIRLAEDNSSYNRVEARRRGYFPNDKQTEFDFSTPTSEEAHADPQGEAVRSVLRLRGNRASILANRISKDFIDRSAASLIGQEVRSARDLATIAQVYRNPSFETFRAFIVSGEGEIISQSGVTSRLPGAVYFSEEADLDMAAMLERAQAEDPGAKLWMLHNHPSGNASPSTPDRNYTRKISGMVGPNSVAGHVIINNKTFTELDQFGDTILDNADLDVVPQYNSDQNQSVPHPLIGQRITGAGSMAQIAKDLEGRDHPIAVQLSRNKVSGIIEFPVETLNAKNPVELLAMVRKIQLTTGSSAIAIVNLPEVKAGSKLEKNLIAGARSGVMLDYIDQGGNHLLQAHFPPDRGERTGRDSERSLRVSEPEVGYKARDEYQVKLLERAKKQPIDTAFMLPFAAAAGLGKKTGVSAAVRHAAGSGAQAAGNYYSEKMGFLHPVVETGATLFIDRYGLPAEYKKLDQSRTNKERSLQMRALDLVRKIEGELGNDLKTARAFQRVLTSEVPAGRDMQALGEEVRNEITALGERAVSLGMVSRESFERNKAIYLHRVYEQYEVADNGSYGIGAKFLKNRRTRIMGDAFKGRGIFQEVKNNRLSQDLPDGLLESRQMDKGSKFRIVDMIRTDDTLLGESDNRKVVKRYYLKTNQDIPTIDGTEAVDRGVFEVRQTKKNSVVLWRDYSESERTKMGEITDSRYTLIRTMQILSHDLATGEFYRDIAKNDAWTWNQPGEPDSENILEGSEIMLNAYRPLYGVEWVRMPDATIPKSGGKKKYGDLSGKYIRAEIYRDLMAIQAQQNPNLWTKLLSQWKVNKTARNPVTHMNNVMSNVILADLVDVRADHLVAALKSWAAKDTNHREATELGAFGGGFIEGEIKAEVLDRVIREIEAERNNTENDSLLDSVLAHTTMGSMIEKLAALDNAALSAYQLEDEVFRLAAFIKFKEEGMNPDDAAIKARDQFLNYDIRAPGVNALRRTILPFASYTYRAVPVIAEAVMKRPWKIAKYFGMAWMFQAMAYAITGGDEDEERRSLRDEESGFTWIGLPRMVRMPWNTNDGRPVFLDSRRWIPAGDVFDTAQGSSAIPIPAPLQPGGPIGMVFEVMLNKQGFTGQEITNELADDNTTKALKIADYLWKSWMPSNVLIPGSWYQQKIYDAATGAVDRTGRDYSVAQAIASSFGIKLKPQDVSYNMQLKAEQLQRTVRAIRTEINRLSRKKMRNQVSDASYDRQMARYLKQLNNVQEKARETFSPTQ